MELTVGVGENWTFLLDQHADRQSVVFVGGRYGHFSALTSLPASGKLLSMRAHKTTVVVQADHQVMLHLPEDFPAGEADVIVLPRPPVGQTQRSLADFDRFFAALPIAPVVTLASLDRGELYR
jgi:hypothetical protein